MKKSMRLAVCVLALLCLVGCVPLRERMIAEDRLILPQESPEAALAPEQSGRGNVDIYLYYQVRDSLLMAPERRTLRNVAEEELLTSLVRELLRGPESTDLHSWFPADTTLAELSQTRDIVYVTLSREFLNAPEDAPVNWMDDPDWTAYVLQRRRLALDCLVNTVTQLGGVSRVQVLVLTEGSRGSRLTMADVGLAGEDPTQPLEPLTRADDLIFTPEAAAEALLSAFARKEWGEVSAWTARTDPIFGENGDAGVLALSLSTRNPSLLQYEVSTAQIVSGDTAIVTVRLEEAGEAGLRTVYESMPLRFVMDGALWKIAPVSLEQLVTNAQ